MGKTPVPKFKQTFLISSGKTGGPYVTEKRESHLFDSEAYANVFAEQNPNTFPTGPVYGDEKSLMRDCYAAGAETVVVHRKSEQESKEIPEDIMGTEYCLHDLAAAVSMLKQTKKKKYLKDMAETGIIVPVKIENEEDIVSIVYSAARTMDETETAYVAFSSLEEYRLWAARVEGFTPLEVRFRKLCRIAGRYGILINPYGNRLFLKPETLEFIRKQNKTPHAESFPDPEPPETEGRETDEGADGGQDAANTADGDDGADSGGTNREEGGMSDSEIESILDI